MNRQLESMHITRLIEADYRQRGVFPMLRVELCERPYAAGLYFSVPMDIVHAMKSDAEKQREFAKPSMRRAYGALIKQMNHIIRRPEIEAEKRQRKEIERQKFKTDAIKSATGFLRYARAMLWKDDGFRFDNETLTEVESLMGKLEDTIAEGRVVHPSDDDDNYLQPASTTDCKSNAALQNFLQAAVSDLSLVKNENPEGV